eukprot:11188363-Lingulodinium_polyedra.AAC.1
MVPTRVPPAKLRSPTGSVALARKGSLPGGLRLPVPGSSRKRPMRACELSLPKASSWHGPPRWRRRCGVAGGRSGPRGHLPHRRPARPSNTTSDIAAP